MDIKNIVQLEKQVISQEKELKLLKKAMAVLELRLIHVSKKAERSYHTGIKNTNEINSIQGMLKRNL